MSINLDYISGIPSKMIEKQILLAYKGEFSTRVVNSILTNGKTQLSKMKIELHIRKKVYNIMVESLENISRYQKGSINPDKMNKTHSPLFILGKKDSGFYITVGNLICQKDIDPLKTRLEAIKNLDRSMLKQKYRDAIQSSIITDNSGAGLGLIDMALKSNNKINYTFTEVAKEASKIMNDSGSLLTLTYESTKVIPNYNVMGVCKSALETSVKYLARDLGEKNIRVNAISAGPIKTLAASAIGDAKFLYKWNEDHSLLKRNVDIDDVGGSALYLLSDLAAAVTGEIHYVDAGYNKVGMPNPKNIINN